MADATLTLDAFKINGVRQFMSPGDDADQCLDEAHALLTVLSTAFDLSEIYNGSTKPESEEDPLETLRPFIVARAIEGVTRLIGLGRYRNDIYVSQVRASRRAA